MVLLINGVVKEVPVPMELPPVDAAYQFKVPALVVAPRVTVPASQRAAGVVDVIVGVLLMVATTAVLDEVQLVVEAST